MIDLSQATVQYLPAIILLPHGHTHRMHTWISIAYTVLNIAKCVIVLNVEDVRYAILGSKI